MWRHSAGSDRRVGKSESSRDIKIISAALLLLVFPQLGLSADNPTPELTLETYFAATRDWDAARISNMIHPEALSQFRQTFDRAFSGSKKSLALEELLPLFTLSTVEEYDELSDREIYQRLNETIAQSQPQIVKMMASSQFEIVGKFAEGDVTYVTYILGIDVDGRLVEQEVVQKLKKYQGSWYLLLPSTAAASIAAIESRYNLQ